MKFFTLNILLLTSLYCYGAAESSIPAAPQFVTIAKARLPYQLAFDSAAKFTDSRFNVHACLVADPNLESDFSNSAETLLASCSRSKFNHSVYDMERILSAFRHSAISPEALERGVVEPKIVIFFVASCSSVSRFYNGTGDSRPLSWIKSYYSRSSDLNENSGTTSTDDTDIWFAKEEGPYVTWTEEFSSLPHVKALKQGGYTEALSRIKANLLKETDCDIAVEINGPMMQEYFAKLVPPKKAAVPTDSEEEEPVRQRGQESRCYFIS